MPDTETKHPFDWKEWLSKQGFVSVLLVAVLWFFRQDVWMPVKTTMEAQTKLLGEISVTQTQMRDEARVGIWRSTAPPSPSELPRGVEPAKENP